MKKILLLAILIIASTISTSAQEVELTDIPARKFEGVKELKGIGYYTFYFDERAKKGYRDFTLKVYDYDLKEIKTSKINLPKHVQLVDGTFNGKNLLLGFIDAKKKNLSFVTFDSKGNKIKERYDEIKNKFILEDARFQPKLFSTEGGFYIAKVMKVKKYGFTVEKVDENLKIDWTKEYIPEKGLVLPTDAFSDNGVLAIISTQYPSVLSKKYDVNLSAFDSETGKFLFDKQVNSESYYPIPSSVSTDTDGSVILGGMYYIGDKEKNKGSDGVFLTKYAKTGKLTFSKMTPWAAGLKSAVNAELKKSFLDAKPMILFHDVETTTSGYRVIGEAFKKSVDALQSILSGSINLKFTTLDFAIIDFDKEGKVEGVEFIKKEPRSIDLEFFYSDSNGNSNISPLLLTPMRIAKDMKRYKMFSYRFTVEDTSGDDAIVYYNDPSNGTFSTGKPYIGVARVSDLSNPVKKEIRGKDSDFKKGVGRIGFEENTKGKIMIWKHDKSEKTLNMWIQDF